MKTINNNYDGMAVVEEEEALTPLSIEPSDIPLLARLLLFYFKEDIRQEAESLLAGQEKKKKPNELMTTPEAAEYLRRSTHWLLTQRVPYLKGVPNLYRRQDLDDWVERNLERPRVI